MGRESQVGSIGTKEEERAEGRVLPKCHTRRAREETLSKITGKIRRQGTWAVAPRGMGWRGCSSMEKMGQAAGSEGLALSKN